MSDGQQREGDECRPAGVKPRPSHQWLAKPQPRPPADQGGCQQHRCYADPFEDADREQLPHRHPFPRQLPGGNRRDLCLIARRPHQLERRTIPLVCYLDEDEVRAASEPDFRRVTAVDLHRPSRRWPQLEPVESLAEDGQVPERARARLILVGERLSGEPAGDVQRRSRRRRRDRGADHGRDRGRPLVSRPDSAVVDIIERFLDSISTRQRLRPCRARGTVT